MDAWQLDTWESYRDVARIGRYRRLSEIQRKAVWPVFQRVRSGLREQGLVTKAEMFGRLTREVERLEHPPFHHVVVDEAQDVSVAQLRFLAALAGGRANGLFFAGDLGQRIFQQPFSWKDLGVDVRGRSQTLRINYRTSHQIRTQADRFMDPAISDVDGNLEERKGTVSVFNGPQPTVQVLEDEGAEFSAVSECLTGRISEGLQPGENPSTNTSEPVSPGRVRRTVESPGRRKMLTIMSTSSVSSVRTCQELVGYVARPRQGCGRRRCDRHCRALYCHQTLWALHLEYGPWRRGNSRSPR